MDSICPVDDKLTTLSPAGEPITGFKDLWRNSPAFLVCGGPSLKQIDLTLLQERGVVSLGVNNVAAHARTTAFVFDDPPEKFHHSLFQDPRVLKFVPHPKLKKGETRIKTADRFRYTGRQVRDGYPSVVGFRRCCEWNPETFLTNEEASWGNNLNGHNKNGRPRILSTMLLGIRLMHFLGVRRVYLLGVDFGMDPANGTTGNYAFAQERDQGAIDSNNHAYSVLNTMLIELRPILEKAGFQLFNCNEHSRLRAFDYVPFADALEDCRCGIPAEPPDLSGWYVKGETQPAA
jgi:hypothetical protein